MKLSLTDASHLLGKTPRQVRYLIKENKIPALKVGGRWLDRPLEHAFQSMGAVDGSCFQAQPKRK